MNQESSAREGSPENPAPPSRPLGWILLFVYLASAGLFVLHKVSTDPVDQWEFLLIPAKGRDVSNFRVLAEGPIGRKPYFARRLATGRFQVGNRRVLGVYISCPPAEHDALSSIVVSNGSRSAEYKWSQAKECPIGSSGLPTVGEGNRLYRVPVAAFTPSRLPPFSGILNWSGDEEVVVDAAVRGTMFASLLLLGVLLLGRSAVAASAHRALFRSVPGPREDSPGSRAWVPGGLALLVACLVGCELVQPFYFTQDDNYSQFLPVMLQGCRGLAEGVFPTWNPSQFAGAPTTSLGVYALTYPPTYLSHLIAERFLGNAFALLEVFAAAHIVLGYLAVVRLVRAWGGGKGTAALAGLSISLSGYVLIVGRSWYYVIPALLWLPLALLAIKRLERQAGIIRWQLVLGASLGALFHAGNAQIWVYAMLFASIVALVQVLACPKPWTMAGRLLAGFVLGSAIAWPLFRLQYLETAAVERFAWGRGIADNLWSLILPYPLQGRHPNLWGNAFVQYMGQLYYSGTVCVVVVLLALLLLVVRMVDHPARPSWTGLARFAHRNVFLLCALVAFDLSLGDSGLLWNVMSVLPVFSKFTNPFKFLFFLDLFLAVQGALYLESLLTLLRERKGPARTLLLVGAFALLAYHVSLCRTSFCAYGSPPYPPPRGIGAEPAIGGGRILSVAPQRSTHPDYPSSRALNFATLHGEYSLDGYDPLVIDRPEDLALTERIRERGLPEACRAYGVATILSFKDSAQAMKTGWELRGLPVRRNWVDEMVRRGGPIRRVGSDSILDVYRLDGSEPMAHLDSGSRDRLAWRAAANGIAVRVPPSDRTSRVILSFLRRPYFISRFRGTELPTRHDQWGRIVVDVPPGPGGTLEANYEPPWLPGIRTAIGMVLLALAISVFVERFRAVKPAT